ncbi:MAG: aminotransferase class IV [Proteobacteria bacterium]|jgi:branched-chain amino acid aminotransferase|nr:aminotransferase class IV [Pseudomonadota bacterium]
MPKEKDSMLNISSLKEITFESWKPLLPPNSPAVIFYSSVLRALTRDPRLMTVPVDDHMVHRGDGVFEALKFLKQKIYLLQDHLSRLTMSAERISLQLPLSVPELAELLQLMVQKSGLQEGLIRLYISRGGGDFTPNPYTTTGSQIFVAITELKAPSREQRFLGVRIGKYSQVGKMGWMAQVKSCNYLPNVMMKKEAVDRGVEFMVSFDEDGYLQEGPTENIALVSRKGQFLFPFYRNILKGTTLNRLTELILAQGLLPVEQKDIQEEDLLVAQEVFMLGTTLDVLPVKSFESQNFTVGPWGLKFQALIEQDQK